MCTMIAEKAPVSGSGKGSTGWFVVDQVYLGYDHPFHAPLDHALTLDFVNEQGAPGQRVAVELTRESARVLAERLLEAVDRADRYEATGS